MGDWLIGMWGAAPRPGREKFSLHPRHVYDVPEGRPSRRYRRCRRCRSARKRAMDKSPVQRPIRRALARALFSVLRFPFSGARQRPLRPHRRQGRQPRLQPLWLLQASKPLSFQASNCPCTPGTSATCQKDSAVGHIGRIGPIGRSCAGGLPKNQSMACEARHAPSGPRAGRAPCAHARPAPCVAPFVSLAVEGLSLRACTVSFVIPNYSGSLRVSSWFFVNLRVSPAGQTLHTLPAVPSVAPDHYRVGQRPL